MNDPTGDVNQTPEDKRGRIREIDDALRMLRGELGEPNDDPQDFGDAGQALQARADRDAQIETLENERERLQQELGE
ncbi:hypothetical protein [Actinomadura hibisca]|uniref:hypothetical protein n=1 Tax=Actinomadura hibisca TaxID=68565 RepID=UPI00082AF9DF|nr:hypothetical protein [Actinomadura hibisca]